MPQHILILHQFEMPNLSNQPREVPRPAADEAERKLNMIDGVCFIGLHFTESSMLDLLMICV